MDRTAVLIIDSADIDHLRDEMAAGNMPNLAGFLAEAAFTPTRNITSHRSEVAWAQFLAGATARESGWYGWWTFRPEEYRTVGTGCSRGKPFYAVDPVESVIIDAIQSHARPEVPGSQIFAYAAHSPQFPRSSVPAGLLSEAVADLGHSRLFNNDHQVGWYDEQYVRGLGEMAVDGLSKRSELTRWMVRRTPDWRFLLGSVSEYHGVGHHTWHGHDTTHLLAGVPSAGAARQALASTVAAVDSHIAEFLEVVGDATVVIGAHHGFQAADDLANSVLLPELWHRWLIGGTGLHDPDQAAWRANGMPPIVLGPRADWSQTLRTHFRPSPRDIPRSVFSRLPPAVYDRARSLRGGPPHPGRREFLTDETPEADLTDPGSWQGTEDLAREVPHWYRRYWPAMRSFVIPSFDDGRIRINLRGRERDGIVEPANYERELSDIEAFLRKIVDARTDEPLVGEIVCDKLHDPMDPAGPDADMVVRWNRATDSLEHPDIGTVGPHPFMRTASHREEGWFAVRGAGATPGRLHQEVEALRLSTIVDQLRRGASFDQAQVRAFRPAGS